MTRTRVLVGAFSLATYAVCTAVALAFARPVGVSDAVALGMMVAVLLIVLAVVTGLKRLLHRR